jgi:hypothetical protein
MDEPHKGSSLTILMPDHVVHQVGFIWVCQNDGKEAVSFSEISIDRNGRDSTSQRKSPVTIWEPVFVDKMFLMEEVPMRVILEESHHEPVRFWYLPLQDQA